MEIDNFILSRKWIRKGFAVSYLEVRVTRFDDPTIYPVTRTAQHVSLAPETLKFVLEHCRNIKIQKK
jgi:hypothetical protein